VISIRNKAETGEIDQFFTRSRRHRILNNSEIDETINIIFDKLRTKLSTFIATSTNVEVLEIVRLDMHIDKYEPIKDRGYVALQEWITKTRQLLISKTRITYVSSTPLNLRL